MNFVANPVTPLKLSATLFAMLWTGWMIWWSGSFDAVNIGMLTLAGAAAGYFWFLAMRWYFRRAGLLPGR